MEDPVEMHFVPRKNIGVSKYMQIADYLGKWIRDRHIPTGNRFPSDRQVAAILGISTVTLNKSLKELERTGLIERRPGSGTFISVPAKAFSNKKNRALRIGIACHVPITSDWYATTLVNLFHEYWKDKNCEIVSLTLAGTDYRQGIEEYKLDGLFIVLPQRKDIGFIRSLAERNFPFVTTGAYFPELPMHSLHCDYILPAVKAVKYLSGSGHRKIGYVTSDFPSASSQGRFKGYMQGMFESGLSVDPLWLSASNIFSGDPAFSLDKSLETMLSADNRPTALLVHSHNNISAILSVSKRIHLQIPDDISIIGFDDPPYLEHLDPSVTTFRQPLDEMVGLAGKKLEMMIRTGEQETSGIFEPVFIERASCSAPRNSTEKEKSN
ncbi:MAG: GntR family transcriptional regulator [Candidatus Izemoplasmatales bacterium]|nr:GntR family transcriptional regulator [Candidatus Izemoplasmatales bacterium]